MSRAVFTLMLSASVLGCGNEITTSGATSGTPGPGKGLDAPDNDAAVVALARKALACPWGGAGPEYDLDYDLEADCADLKAFDESDLIQKGKADATLVNLLDDADEKVRYIGAWSLERRGEKYRTDKALAERVLDAALAETTKYVAYSFGGAVGRISLTVLGLVERAKPLGKAPTLKEKRLGFLGTVQSNNSDAFYAYTVDLAKTDPDYDIRTAATWAFWTGTPSGKSDEVCKLWLDSSQDATNEAFASLAAKYVAFYPLFDTCKGQWGALLQIIDKRVKAGTIESLHWPSALQIIHDQEDATAAQKKEAMRLARAMAENPSNGDSARGLALDMIAERAPDAEAFLNRFARAHPDMKTRVDFALRKMKERRASKAK